MSLTICLMILKKNWGEVGAGGGGLAYSLNLAITAHIKNVHVLVTLLRIINVSDAYSAIASSS